MSAQSTMTAKETRQLTFSGGGSHKFWNIELDGTSHTVTFGRIGTNGQTQTKDFDTEEAARKSYDKLVAEKTKKGYVDAAGSSAVATTAKASSPPPKSTAKTTPTKPAGKEKEAAAKADEKQAETIPEPVSAASADPAADCDLSVTRHLDLSPSDYEHVAYRAHEPVERETPEPFDKEACLAWMSKLSAAKQSYYTYVQWGNLELPRVMSREQAHFWLEASTTQFDRTGKMQSLADTLRKKKTDGKIDVDEIRKFIEKRKCVEGFTCQAIANLISVDDYVELMLSPPDSKDNMLSNYHTLRFLIQGFNRCIYPYLTEKQLQAIQKRIKENWDPHQEPAPDRHCFPAEYYLAAALGMTKEVHQVTSHWADDRYASNWQQWYEYPHDIVYGLGTPEAITSEWRRLQLRMRSAEDLRQFIAATEYCALDLVAEMVIAESSKDRCEELLKVFSLVRAPEVAEWMLRCKLDSKAPAAARAWLDKNVGRSVAGLIELAGGKGNLADAAIEYLGTVKRRGLQDVITAALQTASPEAKARVQAEVIDHEEKVYDPLDAKSTPKWLAEELDALAKMKKKALPGWAAPAELPPLLVGDHRLNDDQMQTVLQVLAATPAGQKHALLTALRENLPKATRDNFAWKLFQAWQMDGYPTKEKWAMGTIAHLGDDDCVLKLTPLIRVWPGESQHPRAVFGLECLRAIGSSIALMQLSGIAQKLKFKGLKGKAEQFVTEIAQERGLTRDELEDRVVPDCGLDESGRREFNFGPRSFSFVLGGDLKAMVRDEAGKLRPNLPAPNAKDDQALANESMAEWKLAKKQIKEVATIQAGRLEQAMVTGRRWNVDDFSSLLVRHPLMTHLAQKLIWAGFDAQGKPITTFRVTEERDYANPDDDAVDLKGVVSVGVVHPLEMSAAEAARWGEVLGDYEVVAPFPQLGRPVYKLDPNEEKGTEITSYQKLKLVAPTLVFTLEKLNWIRGVAMDAGCFDEHSKQFPAANVTAVIRYEGVVGMGYIDPNEELTTTEIYFSPGLRGPSCYDYGRERKTVKLKDVPPIVISEVLADLQVLKSKAK